MEEYIKERAVVTANHTVDHSATVRWTVKKFGINKSTIHEDVTDRLKDANPSLVARTRVVLGANRFGHHIRGGIATKKKYQYRPQICGNGEEE